MGSLLEMTASIVASHVTKTEMNSEDLIQELKRVHASLQRLVEEPSVTTDTPTNKGPAMSLKKAFRSDQVFCLVCGKGGMKTLTRHLSTVHELKPGAYRRQFGIPTKQALTASDFSDARKKMANERGLADNLMRAREIRAANMLARKGTVKGSTKAKTTGAKAH